MDLDSAQWQRDGNALIVCGKQSATGRWQLWLQPYPSGEPRRLTNEPEDYVDVTMTTDGTALTAIRATESGRVTVSGGKPDAESVLIPDSPDEQAPMLSASSGNAVAVQVYRGAKSDIWMADVAAGTTTQVTSDGQSYGPLLTADGKTILFTAIRGDGVPHVWRMDADGSNARQLTHGTYEALAGMPSDASWYLYDTQSQGLWKGTSSGTAAKFADTDVSDVAVSPDGRWIAEVYMSEARRRLRIVSSAGGAPRVDADFESAGAPGWLPGGEGVTYLKSVDGTTNVFMQPLSGGEPRRLTSFSTKEAIKAYACLTSGKVVVSRVNHDYDAVLITDFR